MKIAGNIIFNIRKNDEFIFKYLNIVVVVVFCWAEFIYIDRRKR